VLQRDVRANATSDLIVMGTGIYPIETKRKAEIVLKCDGKRHRQTKETDCNKGDVHLSSSISIFKVGFIIRCNNIREDT
jgi:hypothetical protein